MILPQISIMIINRDIQVIILILLYIKSPCLLHFPLKEHSLLLIYLSFSLKIYPLTSKLATIPDMQNFISMHKLYWRIHLHFKLLNSSNVCNKSWIVFILKPFNLCIFICLLKQYLQIESPVSNRLSPDISPIVNANGADIVMTPFLLGLEVDQNMINEISFQTFQLQPQQNQNQKKRQKKKQQSYRPRLGSSWHVVQNELEKIIEEDNLLGDYEYDLVSSSYQDSNQDSFPCISEVQSSVYRQSQKIDTDKISFNNFQVKESHQPLLPQWQSSNPKAELMSKLKKITIEGDLSAESKIQAFKSTLSDYVFQFQKYYFEQAFKKMRTDSESDIKKLEKIIFEGINQTFKKKIGGLPFEKRRIKLLKYLDKKKRRVWQKKVNYDCRKKVADCRLRIKGKFVTLEQACEQLGIAENQSEKSEKIKQILIKQNKQ